MSMCYFKVYFSSRELLVEKLNDAQRGRVLTAMFDYAQYGKVPENLDIAEDMAFTSQRIWLDANAQSYQARVAANQENGRRGGRPKSQNAEAKPNGFSLPKEKDKDKDKAKTKANTEGSVSAADAAKTPLLPPSPETFFAENFTAMTDYYKRELHRFRKQGCDDALLLCAMQEALDHDAVKWCYVRRILERCVSEGLFAGTAYRQSKESNASALPSLAEAPRADFTGGGHNVRVDRAQPSGSDWLREAAERPHRLKRTDALSPGGENPSPGLSA